jgi:hypothetical protein
MMLKWKHEFDYGKKPTLLSTEQVIARLINDNDQRGEFEELRSRVDKLTEIVANLVDNLHEKEQKKIVEAVAWCWKPLEEL